MKKINYVAVKNDISKRKTAEQKIKEYTQFIENELKEKQISLKKLQSVQKSLTPIVLPNINDTNILSFYMPSEELGGDMFDIQHRGNKLIVIMADCTGHGLYAAMDTVLVKSISDQYFYLLEEEKTDEFLYFVNKRIINYFFGENFLTMFVCVLNLDTKLLTYSNAASELPYIINNSSFEKLEKPKGHHIGLFEHEKFGVKQKQLIENDILFIYSDAVREIILENGKIFDHDGIEQIIPSFGKGLKNDLKHLLVNLKKSYGKLPLEDDTTIILIENIGIYKENFEIKSKIDFEEKFKKLKTSYMRYNYDSITIEEIYNICKENYLKIEEKINLDVLINCEKTDLKFYKENNKEVFSHQVERHSVKTIFKYFKFSFQDQ